MFLAILEGVHDNFNSCAVCSESYYITITNIFILVSHNASNGVSELLINIVMFSWVGDIVSLRFLVLDSLTVACILFRRDTAVRLEFRRTLFDLFKLVRNCSYYCHYDYQQNPKVPSLLP